MANAGVVSTKLESNSHYEFEIFGGGTQAVLDYLGYFAPPGPTALNCVATTVNTDSVPANTTTSFNAPACPAGYTGVVAYCWNQDQAGLVSGGSGVNSNIPGRALFCEWINTTSSALNASDGAMCCQVQ